jgi:hypothetical protein
MKQNYGYFLLFLCLFFIISTNCSERKKRQDTTQQGPDIRDLMKGFKCSLELGVEFPFRIGRDGDLECFSLDNKNCVTGFDSTKNCQNFVINNIQKVLPVQCKDDFFEKKDQIDYSTKQAWCKKVKNILGVNWSCFQQTGMEEVVRINLETMYPECLLTAEGTCANYNSFGKCGPTQLGLDPATVQVKKCEWNDLTNIEDNWCKRAMVYFRYTSEFFCSWINNDNQAMSILNKAGDIACIMADNGRECVKQNNVQNCENQTKTKKYDDFKLIDCGKQHKALAGYVGYERNNWCKNFMNNLLKRPSKKSTKSRFLRKIK